MNKNYAWYVSLKGHTGDKKVLANTYSIDAHGNLNFWSLLDDNEQIQSHIFANGIWTAVYLSRPALVAFDNVLGS